eukprot:IDg6126t1
MAEVNQCIVCVLGKLRCCSLQVWHGPRKWHSLSVPGRKSINRNCSGPGFGTRRGADTHWLLLFRLIDPIAVASESLGVASSFAAGVGCGGAFATRPRETFFGHSVSEDGNCVFRGGGYRVCTSALGMSLCRFFTPRVSPSGGAWRSRGARACCTGRRICPRNAVRACPGDCASAGDGSTIMVVGPGGRERTRSK